MSKFLDFNPENGAWVETDYSAHEDKITVSRKQDLQGVLDYAKANRNSGINDKIGKDFFFSKYAIIPAVVQVDMMKKGIDINNPHQTKEVMKEINQNYPHLKMTNLTHDGSS